MINITIDHREDGKIVYKYKSDNWMKVTCIHFDLKSYFEEFVKNDFKSRYQNEKMKSLIINIDDMEPLLSQKGTIPVDFIFKTLRAEIEIELDGAKE